MDILVVVIVSILALLYIAFRPFKSLNTDDFFDLGPKENWICEECGVDLASTGQVYCEDCEVICANDGYRGQL